MTHVELQTVVRGITMAKDLLRLTFLTWLMRFNIVFADIYSSDYDVTYGCDVTYGIAIETATNIRSITECCFRCHGTGQCLSVKYDQGKSWCQLNSHRHPLVNNTCNAMFEYANKISNKQLINNYCTIAGEDCSVLHSKCVWQKCECVPGYSYRHYDESCVRSCNSYGTTFSRHPHHSFGGSFTRTKKDLTIEGCKHACVEETSMECRAISYNPKSGYCKLTNGTARPYIGDYDRTKAEYDRYQRNCQ